jgi:hypothetical protein
MSVSFDKILPTLKKGLAANRKSWNKDTYIYIEPGVHKQDDPVIYKPQFDNHGDIIPKLIMDIEIGDIPTEIYDISSELYVRHYEDVKTILPKIIRIINDVTEIYNPTQNDILAQDWEQYMDFKPSELFNLINDNTLVFTGNPSNANAIHHHLNRIEKIKAFAPFNSLPHLKYK